MIEAIKLVSAALGGGIIAACLTHYFTRRRERERDAESRKRDFRAFLSRWRSELERIPEPQVAEIIKHYKTTVHEFHAAKGRVRGDFLPVAEFDRLSGHLGGFRDSEITNSTKKTRDIIAEAIDELIRFTKDG
jgi:hypothetical protein